jgi:TusA-related sulfurtransferase
MSREFLNDEVDSLVVTGAILKAIQMNPLLKLIIQDCLNKDNNEIINEFDTGGALRIASAETVKYLNQKRLEMLSIIEGLAPSAMIEELEINLLGAIDLAVLNLKDGVPEAGDSLNKLYTFIQGIQTILASDNIDMDNVQEIVNVIEEMQVRFDTILVNNLVDGGTTKALTAEQGKLLKILVDEKASIGDLTSITSYLEGEIVAAKDEIKGGVPSVGDTLNKIYDLLIARPSVPIKHNIAIPHTGVTSEEIIYSVLIPAGTFQGNDWLEISAHILSNSSANTKTIRLYFNTIDSLIDATIWGTRILPQTTSQGFKRNLIFQNSISSQRTIIGPTVSRVDDLNYIGTSNLLSIDFSIDQYFILSGQLAVGTDSITLGAITSLIRR